MKIKSILGSLMPLKSFVKLSVDEAKLLATRWDVPQANSEGLFDAGEGQMLPLAEDLADRQSHYILSAPDERGRQHRIAGRMLAEDLGSGSTSAATPLLFGAFAIAAMLTSVLPGGFRLVPGVLALALLGMIRIATAPRQEWAAYAAMFGLGLPLFGSLLQTLAGGGLIPAAVAIALLLGLGFFWKRGAGVGVILSALLVSGLVVAAVTLLPPALRQVGYMLPCILLPMAYATSELRERAIRLALQGAAASGEDVAFNAHMSARRTQAIQAAKDKSVLLFLGQTMGALVKRLDGFAADMGLRFAISLKDLATHLIIFGETGSGKTSTLLRPIIAMIMRARKAGERLGLFMADGKGALAGEHAGMKDFTPLNPRHEVVSLYEGLSASDVARQHEENNMPAAGEGEGGNSKIFSALCAACCRPSAYMLEALVKHQICDKSGQPWKWSLLCHDRLGKLFLSGDEGQDEIRSYWEQIAQAEGAIDGMLEESYLYSTQTVTQMPGETLGSVLANWTTWFQPYTSHPDLQRWAAADTGARVEDCLHGKAVGLDVNGSLYGQLAANLIQKFLKARVLGELQRRAGCENGDWQKADPTATPCYLVIDEFQDLQTTADADLIPKARSLGGHYIVATQTIESLYQTSRNQNSTKAMLASLLSRISLRTSAATMQWLQESVGMGRVPQREGSAVMVDFTGSVSKAYNAPLWDVGHPLGRILAGFRRLVGGMHFKDARVDRRQGRTGAAATELHASELILVRDLKEEPILELSKFSALTADMGVAFASIRRGGVPRRDFIRVLEPLHSIPDDLLDPEFAGRRDLNAEDAVAREAAIEAALAADAEQATAEEQLSITHDYEETHQPLTALLDAIRNPETINEEK